MDRPSRMPIATKSPFRIAWGLGGVSAAQSGQTASISIAALVGAALLAVLALVTAVARSRRAATT